MSSALLQLLFFDQLPVCQIVVHREDKRKWWFLKQVQSGTVKQGQSCPCLSRILKTGGRGSIPSKKDSIWWERMMGTITLGAFRCLYLYLSSLQLYFPFKNGYIHCIMLRNSGNAFQETGVFSVVNFHLNRLNPKFCFPSLTCKCMKKLLNLFWKPLCLCIPNLVLHNDVDQPRQKDKQERW